MANLKALKNTTQTGNVQSIHSDYASRSSEPVSNSPQSVVDGDFYYHNPHEGLSVHYGEVTEVKSLSVTNQLPPGLSINLIFEGEVSFALADQRHKLAAPSGDVQCSLYVLSRPESLTRYFQQGMRVKKLNIFAELKWLKRRCSNAAQVAQLNRLFETHAQLDVISISSDMIKLATDLMSSNTQQQIGHDLILESKAMQFLSSCMQQSLGLKHETKTSSVSDKAESDLNTKVSQLIVEESAEHPMSLQEIADQLNLSVSTLQRRFKSIFGMTVIEYARIERLEKAKKALIFDDLSVGEVAYLSGYQHTSNFISAFTKHYAISPSRYKKNHKRAS